MKLLVRFAPWIVVGVVSRFADWRYGLLAGFVTLVAVMLTSRPRLGFLNGGMLAFFVVLGTVAVVFPEAPVQPYMSAMSMGWLTLVAGFSMLVGRPFTMDFARQQVPAEVAASPGFLATNMQITNRWTGSFALIALIDTVGTALGRPVLATVGTIVLLIGAVRFTQHTADAAGRDHRSPSVAG